MHTKLALILVAFALACGSGPGKATTTATSKHPSSDPAMTQLLVATAAKDFQTHARPYPARFRSVHTGYIRTGQGETPMLCGQFQAREETGEAQWTSFATIKTSDYEQWIGPAAASFCQQPSITWSPEDDLSTSLQSALDSRP